MGERVSRGLGARSCRNSRTDRKEVSLPAVCKAGDARIVGWHDQGPFARGIGAGAGSGLGIRNEDSGGACGERARNRSVGAGQSRPESFGAGRNCAAPRVL